jgi:hypothetical protein
LFHIDREVHEYIVYLLGSVDFGSSGSMVIDQHGRVIGLVSLLTRRFSYLTTGIVTKHTFCTYFRKEK